MKTMFHRRSRHVALSSDTISLLLPFACALFPRRMMCSSPDHGRFMGLGCQGRISMQAFEYSDDQEMDGMVSA
jgi:hypothetical protein